MEKPEILIGYVIVPNMVLHREDLIEFIGEKAYQLSNKELEDIASQLSKGLMNEWHSSLSVIMTD